MNDAKKETYKKLWETLVLELKQFDVDLEQINKSLDSLELNFAENKEK